MTSRRECTLLPLDDSNIDARLALGVSHEVVIPVQVLLQNQ